MISTKNINKEEESNTDKVYNLYIALSSEERRIVMEKIIKHITNIVQEKYGQLDKDRK